MPKIIGINGEDVLIGLDGGAYVETKKSDMEFAPALGELVEVFQNENGVTVTKKEWESHTYADYVQGSSERAESTVERNYQAETPGQNLVKERKKVNKVVYCLLTIFLGGLGVHKFYAGKIVLGVVYLLFCWTYIPMLISFVEFIIGLCQKADENGMIYA